MFVHNNDNDDQEEEEDNDNNKEEAVQFSADIDVSRMVFCIVMITNSSLC